MQSWGMRDGLTQSWELRDGSVPVLLSRAESARLRLEERAKPLQFPFAPGTGRGGLQGR